MASVPVTGLGAAFMFGVATHLGYFNKNEHHFYGIRYVQITLAGFIFAVAVCMRVFEQSLTLALTNVAALEGCFLAGIYTSCIFYRIFLHPLGKFPGPFGAKISSLWYSSQLGKADAHKLMLKLHRKHGDFVRIGSSDLSCTHPKACNAIYGPGTKCTKSIWYDNDYPLSSMHTTRDRTVHDRRRRIWSPAFSDKALRGYESRITGFGDKLVEQLASFGGKPVDVSKWFNLYSYDVMGDLGLGKSFNMLESGEEHWAIKLLNEGMEPLALNFPSWLFRMITAIPGLAAGYWKFIGYCSDQLHERIRNKPSIPDIMSALLEPYGGSWPQGQELTMMEADSRLIIVAGSDTTAATMTHLFYHLAKDPSQVEKLREELGPFVGADGSVNHVDIQDADHLNGCINEAMRLNPPVPTAIHRKTPPEGITIGDTFIPGDMNVWAPQYVIARRDDIYPDSERFWPERWYSVKDGVTEKTAFAPFNAGTYGCIGRPLALLEIRTITTKLVMNFDVSFAPGEDGKDLIENTRDHFTLGLGHLNLEFKKRKA